jgi:hypothetical protein
MCDLLFFCLRYIHYVAFNIVYVFNMLYWLVYHIQKQRRTLIYQGFFFVFHLRWMKHNVTLVVFNYFNSIPFSLLSLNYLFTIGGNSKRFLSKIIFCSEDNLDLNCRLISGRLYLILIVRRTIINVIIKKTVVITIGRSIMISIRSRKIRIMFIHFFSGTFFSNTRSIFASSPSVNSKLGLLANK